MRRIAGTIAVALALAVVAPAAHAVCTTQKSPAEIGAEEARRLYDCVEAAMVEAYASVEGVPGVPDYRDWAVVSTSPLLSATHGRVFVNHIAGPTAVDLYTRWEGMIGRRLPPGAILAKESFEIGRDGAVHVGPLSLMEKAPPGGAPGTDDWIYTRIYPDGMVQRTGATGGQYLDFCHECHSAMIDHFDGMFFPPKRFRIAID